MDEVSAQGTMPSSCRRYSNVGTAIGRPPFPLPFPQRGKVAASVSREEAVG